VKPIHFVNYASQPHVIFTCESRPRYVWAGSPPNADPKVFTTGDGLSYTFDETHVTCEKCKALI
jgi:hypothetical protein